MFIFILYDTCNIVCEIEKNIVELNWISSKGALYKGENSLVPLPFQKRSTQAWFEVRYFAKFEESLLSFIYLFRHYPIALWCFMFVYFL